MENASKALIIAGAILLSILLISLGIMIFNQAQDVTKNSGMSQAQVSTFNNKFSKYEGKLIKGSEVSGMVQEVVASNGDANNQNDNRLITVTGVWSVTGAAIKNNAILSMRTDDVYDSGYNNDGYVSAISITYKGK